MTRSPRLGAAVAAVCVLVVAGVIVFGEGGGAHERPPQATLPAPPSPVIGRRAPVEPQLPLARTAARRFLRPYLRFLYGRAPARAVGGTTAAVARELRAGHARATPAQARRRPRLAGLEVTLQTPQSAIAAATVADGGPAPYRIVVGLERRAGRWLVSDLGND